MAASVCPNPWLRVPQVVVGRGVSRVELDRLEVVIHRFGNLSPALQHVAETCMGPRVGRGQLNRATQVGQPLFGLASRPSTIPKLKWATQSRGSRAMF